MASTKPHYRNKEASSAMDAYMQSLINENHDLRAVIESCQALINAAIAFADTVEWDSHDLNGHKFIRSDDDLADALVKAVSAYRKANDLSTPD